VLMKKTTKYLIFLLWSLIKIINVIPSILSDESTRSFICLRRHIYMSHVNKVQLIRIKIIFDVYMCRLRHINDPVLSSLKMEGIRLSFYVWGSLWEWKANMLQIVFMLHRNLLASNLQEFTSCWELKKNVCYKFYFSYMYPCKS
jgi:hypothetical protein